MSSGKIQVANAEGHYTLKFVGDVRLTLCTAFDTFLDRMFNDEAFSSVVIDLSETVGIDSTSLGLLAKLSVQAKKRFSHIPTMISPNEDITRILLSMGFDKVFVLKSAGDECCESLEDITCSDCTEQVIKEHVLDAHRTLMSLNDVNRKTFRELVECLENSNKANP